MGVILIRPGRVGGDPEFGVWLQGLQRRQGQQENCGSWRMKNLPSLLSLPSLQFRDATACGPISRSNA